MTQKGSFDTQEPKNEVQVEIEIFTQAPRLRVCIYITVDYRAIPPVVGGPQKKNI